MPKITIIGGGSYSWGPTFLRDLFITPELTGTTITLHDISAQRMDLVYRLGRKMLDEFRLDFRLEQTLSLEEALSGADFVILTITTGGLESMRADLEIPARYGIHQTVGDTTGPGGLARALRNIPVIAQIAQKVNELCPQALFLNYTNPMTTLTRALCLTRTVPGRTVGLCHEYIGVRHKLADLFGVAPEQIQARVVGINHLIWITDLYAAGRRVWEEIPTLAEKILNSEITVDADDSSVFADHARVKAALFQVYGALPAAGDRHIAEFFPHFINESTNWGADYNLRLTRIEDRHEMEMEAKGLIEAALRGDVPLAPFMAKSSAEAANKIIRAVRCGESYTGMMNLPNTGQVSNVPHNAMVETYGVVDATGARALTFGELPAGVQNVLQKHIANQEMTVQAALTGDRDLALQVLLNDPLSSRLNIPQAAQLLEEMLEASKHHLPKFFNRQSQI